MLINPAPYKPGLGLQDGGQLNVETANPGYSVEVNITATGNAQKTAYQLTATISLVEGGAAGSGVKLPVAKPGWCPTIINRSGNSIIVYPHTVEPIDGSSSVTLEDQQQIQLVGLNDEWISGGGGGGPTPTAIPMTFVQTPGLLTVNFLTANPTDQVSLVAPDEINQIGGTDGSWVYSADNPTGTGQAGIGSGNATAGGTGQVFVYTGDSGNQNSGAVNITSGEADAGTSGVITIVSGGGASTGDVFLQSGSASAGNSGNVVLQPGTASGTTGKIEMAGDILLVGGNGQIYSELAIGLDIECLDGTGGGIYMQSSNGAPTANGAAVVVQAGNGGATSGNGASVQLFPGSSTVGNGGSTQLFGGTSANGNGGGVALTGGNGTESGHNGGDVYIQPGFGVSGSGSGHLVLNNIPTADPHLVGAVWNSSGVLHISAG